MSAFSCEAEYYACSSGVKDTEYVRLLLRDLLLLPDDAPAPPILVDSEPAMVVSQGPTQRSRLKHIEFTLALSRCRDYVMRRRVRFEYCSNSAQIDTMFTKQLGPGILLVPGSLYEVCSLFVCQCVVGFNYVLSLTHCGGAQSRRMFVGSVSSSSQQLDVIRVKSFTS